MLVNRDKIIDAVDAISGCPWQAGARGPEAFDCCGQALWIVREVLGVELPDPAAGPQAIEALRGFFERVEDCDIRPLDFLLLESPSTDAILTSRGPVGGSPSTELYLAESECIVVTSREPTYLGRGGGVVRLPYWMLDQKRLRAYRLRGVKW